MIKKVRDAIFCFVLYVINGIDMFFEDIKKALKE